MNQQENNQSPSGPGYPSGSYGYPSNPFPSQAETPFNWKKYFFLLLRNWYWLLITLGIALGIAFFKIRYTIPKYRATATLIIEDDQNGQDAIGQLRAVRYWRRQGEMTNEKAKLSSFAMVKRAIGDLDQEAFWTAHGRIRTRYINKNPRFDLRISRDSLTWFKDKEWFVEYLNENEYHFYRENYIDTVIAFGSAVNLDGWQFTISQIPEGRGHLKYSFVVNNQVSLAKKYRQKLGVEIEEGEGSIIKLQSEGTVREREVDFLNALTSTYINSELERKQQIAENTFLFVDDQIEIILDSLRQSEEQLLTYRLNNNVINLSREGDMAYERLKSFHEQTTQLKLKENYYDYLKNYIQERNDPQTIIAPSIISSEDQILISAVEELQRLYEERENLDISVLGNNPGRENINDRIMSVRLRILEIIDGLIENNDLTLEQVRIEEEAIMVQLKTLPLSEQQLLNITRKYDLYNQFYTYLLQKRAESGIQKAAAVSNARILDPARYDHTVQIGNNKAMILLLSISLGLLIPILILVLRELLDNRVREREDITNQTDIPIIGNIGHAASTDLYRIKEDLNSAFLESLRRIRSNLTFALKGHDRKVILITSSISGEGKTFTAANIATIIAMNNKKVLLVGCDLRKPALHRIFGISNDIGVSSYIIGEKKFTEIIFPTQISNLSVLPAGPIPPNPAELLETTQMKELILKARDEYDYVVIDSPPVALVADAFSIAEYTDLTLYLVRQNFSRKSVLEIATSMRNEEKLPKLYMLINDIQPRRSMGIYYYYGYGKGYYYKDY